jgi:hypothetical protein
MWAIDWWNKEYVRPWEQQASRNDPYYDLEVRAAGSADVTDARPWRISGASVCGSMASAPRFTVRAYALGAHLAAEGRCLSDGAPDSSFPQSHMNWAPNAWNDRKWTVAQGDGLFSHRDRGEWWPGLFISMAVVAASKSDPLRDVQPAHAMHRDLPPCVSLWPSS